MKRFLDEDTRFDRAPTGPLWLTDRRVSRCVVNALKYGAEQLKLYELVAYVVMANHVHVLVWPQSELARITQTVKSFTAHEANQILERAGKRFWQQESFDHWIRNRAELERIANYIEWNPVSAGLVKHPEDWPWSSAARG